MRAKSKKRSLTERLFSLALQGHDPTGLINNYMMNGQVGFYRPDFQPRYGQPGVDPNIAGGEEVYQEGPGYNPDSGFHHVSSTEGE